MFYSTLFRYAQDSSFCWRLFLSLCLSLLILAPSYDAFATGAAATSNDIISTSLCRIVVILTGGIARAIAIIAVFAMGVGMFMGKVSWPVVLPVAVGVTVIFSAAKIVGLLSGDASTTTCPTS